MDKSLEMRTWRKVNARPLRDHHHHHFICSEPNNTAYDSNANEQDQQGSTSANRPSGP